MEAPAKALGGMHPVEAVDGRAVILGHLIDLQIQADPGSPDPTDNAFSRSTCNTLRRAAAVPSTETGDGRKVVDPASYLRAELAIAVEKLGASKGYPKAIDHVLDAIAGSAGTREELAERLTGSVGVAPPDEALADVIASPELTAMLSDAARLARDTSFGQARVDARHALLACLRMPSAQQVLWTDGLADPNEPTTATFDRIRKAIQDGIAAGVENAGSPEAAGDSLGAWDIELGSLQADTAIRRPEPELRSDTSYVRDEPAQGLEDDRLGIANEARSLAEVVCLREPGPPLAVGLFGDWGSGKSSYMNLLEAAINELIERNAEAAADDSLFVGGVVHIKFNAWHYNDADLWASLTSEFFRQLREGGHSGRAKADYSGLVARVAERVAKAEEQTQVNETEIVHKRKSVASLKKEIEALDRNTAKRRAIAFAGAVDAFRSVHPEVAEDVLRHLGLEAATDDDAEKKEALAVEVERAIGMPGRALAVLRGLVAAFTGQAGSLSRFAYRIVLLVVLAIAGLIGLQAAFPAVLGDGMAAMLGAMSVLGGTVAAALGAYRSVQPLFRAADDFVRAIRKSENEAAAELAAKRGELETVQLEIENLEERRRKSVADAARFRGASPQQLLDYFLNETETTRSFDSALGTVSRVRQAFEQLDAIFREGGTADTGKLERIILYIDDLDRCQARQVVRVLEAVHLLLAFPLFVVVVGVDARWLEKSLLEFYEKTLDPADRESPESAGGHGGQATVHDYLEKIFQVPIRLKRLSAMDGEAYAGYIRQSAGPVQYGGGGVAAAAGEGTIATRNSIDAMDVEIKPVPEVVAAGAQEVKLRRDEVAMFEKLGPIAGKTPRAVKRFVNLYRLVRGMRRGAELDAFLLIPETPEPLPYAACQFWLAADSGLQAEQVFLLRRAVAQMSPASQTCEALLAPADLGDDGRVALRDTPAPSPPAGWADMRTFWESLPDDLRGEVFRAFQAVINTMPGEQGLRILQEAMRETRRFSATADWDA